MTDEERALWLQMRQSHLTQVDAIERYLHINPRTAELRKATKETHDRTQEIVQEIERLGRTE